jgi:L-threonylcarbamoyladenylate synthase
MFPEIENIIKVLKSGGIILYPTDTIWGIGCDATNSTAVKKIYGLKDRDISKNMLILIDSINKLSIYSDFIPDIAIELIQLSESPLTIIYPEGKNVAPELLAEDGSIGIRVTNELFTKELISKYKNPLVATSANFSNERYPLNFSEINQLIINSVDYVVNFGQSVKTSGKPSGIIKFYTSGEIKVLRK